ncbi:spore maturation protein CgeB [Methylobacillus rhizosphaerae]|uniref:Spore maturation protein CgeB n=1 Tax=Methylobacillus rhizosphaerae TaxID=551994 RepID=A0A239AGX4_9PROT|nr:glycosyltransferase [Methylobacillus rhizosphaerae]SNR94789.1 spore maturation protein CgeB [Methylobacillus rhizosphaerae]
MQQRENNKILILDGLSQIPLGKEVAEAIRNTMMNAEYIDLRSLKNSTSYKIKSALHKVIHKNSLLHEFENSALASVIHAVQPTHILVISYLYQYIDPRFLQKIAKEGNIKLFLYDTDSCNLYERRNEFEYFLDVELPIYHKIFSFSMVMTHFFRETKHLPAIFLPYGANPVLIKEAKNFRHDVLFVGTCDIRRIFLLEKIRDHVTLYGNRWGKYSGLMTSALKARVNNKKIWGSELYEIMAQSHIVLNINNIQFHGVETGVNLRIFEALSMKKFLLTEYSEELASLFEMGKEIETFRDARELKEKVEFYLRHPEKMQSIAEAGYQKFITHYTWESCTKIMLSKMLE